TDSELAAEALALFKKQAIDFRLGSRVTAAKFDQSRGACIVECTGAEPIECDRVLVAVGRTPATEGLGLETVRIKLDAKGRIPVDDHFRVLKSEPRPSGSGEVASGVYAIGDCVEGPMLAHKAEDDGVACVEGFVTGYSHVDYNLVP